MLKELQKKFGLDKCIEFTNLQKQISKYPYLKKIDVLNYYNKVYSVIETLLDERMIKGRGEGKPLKNKDELFELLERENFELETTDRFTESHLIFELKPAGTYLETIELVKNDIYTVLKGIDLNHFLSIAQNHIFLIVPFTGKTNEKTKQRLASNLQHLVRLRTGTKVSFSEEENNKTALLFHQGTIPVPYSLIQSPPAIMVSCPVGWHEINEDFDPFDYTPDEIINKDIKELSGPAGKGNDAEMLDKILERKYSFLWQD